MLSVWFEEETFCYRYFFHEVEVQGTELYVVHSNKQKVWFCEPGSDYDLQTICFLGMFACLCMGALI